MFTYRENKQGQEGGGKRGVESKTKMEKKSRLVKAIPMIGAFMIKALDTCLSGDRILS